MGCYDNGQSRAQHHPLDSIFKTKNPPAAIVSEPPYANEECHLYKEAHKSYEDAVLTAVIQRRTASAKVAQAFDAALKAAQDAYISDINDIRAQTRDKE